ncbi:E3 ubiquitin ligase BIG BROTHER-related-like [Cannabis sativa]|uniref:E3 ubiquitin ligase BIG BROTHER-related-like n=1 Tax=Cannabis sativa TaxID=3483 RepID=UPI0029CA7EC9|nr:E3 ubiquitin ligase BIG BROTHER-related-like [Cannabis sativa]
MASPQIIGDPYYTILPYNPTRVESINPIFVIHLFANFTRPSVSTMQDDQDQYNESTLLFDNNEEASTTFTNVVVLLHDMLMNNYTAKDMLENSLAGVNLPSSMFFLSDKIIDYGRKMWSDEHRVLSVRVDIDVFVDELPVQQHNDDEGDYEEEEEEDEDEYSDEVYDMDIIPINFVAASKQSIERLKTDHIENGEVVSCSVCFESILAGYEAVKLPCGHKYHEKCIVKWLQTSKFCPLCRSEIA